MLKLCSIIPTYGICLLLCGCGGDASPEKKGPPPLAQAIESKSNDVLVTDDNAGNVSTSPQTVDIEGFKFMIPAGWKRVDLMPAQAGIIAARYLIPVDEDELQLTFTTARGGIEANFARWKGQFKLDSQVEPLEDRISLSDGEAFWIDLRGTFQAGGGGFTADDPRENSRMIGIGIPFGDEEMYLKLVGRAEQVAQVVDQLKQLVKSADLP